MARFIVRLHWSVWASSFCQLHDCGFNHDSTISTMGTKKEPAALSANTKFPCSFKCIFSSQMKRIWKIPASTKDYASLPRIPPLQTSVKPSRHIFAPWLSWFLTWLRAFLVFWLFAVSRAALLNIYPSRHSSSGSLTNRFDLLKLHFTLKRFSVYLFLISLGL